ncbi:MAG: GDP-L-fucose synthase [Nitrospirota bacterium]|nr:GDP-L-fucose synthase [Nitrospirota bacterium]
MDKSSRIFIAGHRGLVGSAILRRLEADGYENIITRTSSELDLTRQPDVGKFFGTERPEYVFLAAAKVGGIMANNRYPAEFIYRNLMIETNVIHSSYLSGVRKLLFLGSSCIYPRLAEQPMKEECLLTGSLEPTNEPYAIAKIAGIKMCQSYNRQYGTNYISAMPTNLYGMNDNFDLETSHVLPAMIRKFHEAKVHMEKANDKAPSGSSPIQNTVELWGTGSPRREFLHVDDLADACLFLMNLDEKKLFPVIRPPASIINIGVGEDLTIKELAGLIKGIVGFDGKIAWNPSKPDGTPKKLLDTGKLKSLGWTPRIGLEAGIRMTYEWFLKSKTREEICTR